MNAPPKLLSVAVLVLCALPYAAGFLAAPRGSVFLGALNNLGDTGQYLAAIRQGTEGHLLYVNRYTSAAVAPALMYPLYTAAGLLAAPLHLSPPVVYLALHAAAALALLVALWRLCRIASPAQPRLAFAVALLGGGLYFPVLLLSGLVSLPFAPVVLTAPELSLFATLLISPHGALGLAAELWAFASYLLWRCHGQTRHLAHLAIAGLALGLCYPFGVAVLLAVVGVDAALRYILPDRRLPATWVKGCAPDSRLVLALLPTLGLALYYAALFHVPPWGASNMAHLPPPGIAVLAAAFGPLLLAALPTVMTTPATAVAWQTAALDRDRPQPAGPGLAAASRGPVRKATLVGGQSAMGRLRSVVGRKCRRICDLGNRQFPASPSHSRRTHWDRRLPAGPCPTRPQSASFAMRHMRTSPPDPRLGSAGLAGQSQAPVPSRVIIVWAVVNPLLLLAPLPQAGRLVSGWSVALALLAAVTLGGMRQAGARRAAGALALSNVMLALLYLAVTWRAANPAYYAPADEIAAVQWLAAHAGPSDVVMASAGSGNLVVSTARCRVVVGQNFETFDWARAQRDVHDFYDTTTDRLSRAAIVRRQHVTLVMAGPYERALGGFNPGGPGYRLVYAGGTIRVYAVRKD